MAIGNLNDKVSQEDVNTVSNKRNPPKYEPGYEEVKLDSESDFEDDIGLFGDIRELEEDESTAEQTNDANNNTNTGIQAIANPYNNQNQQNGQEVKQSEWDKLQSDIIDIFVKSFRALGKLAVEIKNSLKTKTADDMGYFSRNIILTGLSAGGLGIILGIFGTVIGSDILHMSNFPLQILASGVLMLGVGMAVLGTSAIFIIKNSDNIANIDSVSNVNSDRVDNEMEDLFEDLLDEDDFEEEESDYQLNDKQGDNEKEALDILDDLFGSSNNDSSNDVPNFGNIGNNKVDFDNALDTVVENRYLNRKVLFDTFKTFFPINTPKFSERLEIVKDSEKFNYLETISLKAIGNASKSDFNDLKIHLDKAYETFFSYELRITRLRGLNKLEDIAREMEAYFRESSTDFSVHASVDIEGDFYKVIVTKGEESIITLGDVFLDKEACNFFLSEKNKLPIVSGITELGKVVLNDAKYYDATMISGKQRSGKSWYVLSYILSLALFNTPEDVQFIIVDPKGSTLFNTFALLPHVAGLHMGNVIEIISDIIDNEAPRRRKLLADMKCENIWDLREKGIKLPVLYLVIDEYLTIVNSLEDILKKELDSKLQILLSELAYLGIRVLLIAHRSVGAVNKTNRTLFQYIACVRADISEIKTTLDAPKWNRALVNNGDIALRAFNMTDAIFVRGPAVTTTDEDNANLMRTAAKAFYKMGVDIPDMSSLKFAYNRNEQHIRDELSEDSNRVQYSNKDIFND